MCEEISSQDIILLFRTSSLNMLFNVLLRHKHKACRWEKCELHTSLLPRTSFKICNWRILWELRFNERIFNFSCNQGLSMQI